MVKSLQGTEQHGEAVIRLEPNGHLKAECPFHDNCTRSRTTKPGSRRGQGHCVGALVAWLYAIDPDAPGLKKDHKDFKPNFTKRREARDLVKRKPRRFRGLLRLEAPTNDGSDSEPAQFD